jgi:hypothetical protein
MPIIKGLRHLFNSSGASSSQSSANTSSRHFLRQDTNPHTFTKEYILSLNNCAYTVLVEEDDWYIETTSMPLYLATPTKTFPTLLLPSTPKPKRLPSDRLDLERIRSELDICRITSSLIVSGTCWRQRTERLSHRNNVSDMAAFLNARYGKSYMIWNLLGMARIWLLF